MPNIFDNQRTSAAFCLVKDLKEERTRHDNLIEIIFGNCPLVALNR